MRKFKFRGREAAAVTVKRQKTPRERERERDETRLPKNNSGLTTKSKPRPKSTARKPLRDVSNAVKTFSTSIATKLPVKYQEDEEGNQLRQVGDHDGALDRLLLIHSDISSIIHQVIN